MQIDLTSVLLQQGKIEDFSGTLSFASFDTKMGTYKIVDMTPMHVTVYHRENQIVEVEVSGRIAVEIPCSRCLEAVMTPFDFHVQQELDMKMNENERMEALDESDYIEGKVLDVDKLMYNEIIISWPLRVLCQDDCKGICASCGANLNLTSCDCDTASLDPRMAAISDIFSKFKEV